MVDFREQSEGQTVFDMREDEGTDMEGVHGEDPGLDAGSLTDQLAAELAGARDAYLPIESLKQQATTLLVFGERVGGPIGTLLRLAGNAIEMAVEKYEQEYGAFTEGDAPDYHI